MQMSKSPKLTVRVISPEKIICEGKALEVVLPAFRGHLSVLVNHGLMLTFFEVGGVHAV